MAQSSTLLIAHPRTVPTGVQDIPYELIEHTISHLHDDNASLSACAVVCKLWTTPSHRFLFDTLRVIAGTDHQRLRQFADFVPSSKFACQGVRHFSLSHSPDTALHATDFEGPPSADFDLSLLTSLLSKMDRLESLAIAQACWKGSSISSILDEPKIHLPFLTKLSIGPFPFFHKIYHIQIIFDWFPSLRQLSIHEGILVDPQIVMEEAFTYPAQARKLSTPTALRLTTLDYRAFIYANFFVQSISRTLSTQSLRFISARITSRQSVMGIGDLLRIVGPVLEDLRLDLQFLFEEMTDVNSVARCMSSYR